MKQFNGDNYIKYALITPIEGVWGFTSYSDRNGITYRAISGYFPSGQPRNFEIFWSASERIHRFPKDKKLRVLVNGVEQEMKQADYIKNHPACEGSPNASEHQPVLFKELDPVKDAQIVVDRIKRRNDAMNAAFGLEGKELADMAVLLGVFVDDPVFQVSRVAEFANQDPETFFKYFDDGARPVKALLKRAIALNKLKVQGEAIFWEKECIGAGLDQAVSYLLANKEKLQALEALVAIVPQTKPTAKKTK